VCMACRVRIELCPLCRKTIESVVAQVY